jgi:hypothetical protein
MKIYPVRFWATGSKADSSRVKISPFTSLTDARKFFNDMKNTLGVSAELLETEDYSLNKAGVLAAYEQGQKLMREKGQEQGKG